MPLLRSFLIALFRNRPLRRFGERSGLGVRLSSRFVAGIEIDDALRCAIGIVIQAYLYHSQPDIEQLLAGGIRVRLYKGAYKEPVEVAFPRKADVDANCVRLSCLLLDRGIYHGLATHDEAMIAAVKSYVSQHRIDRSRFDFQMLFGVRRDLQRKLVGEGFNVRVYLPFGGDWYTYFLRRLAERPTNVLFFGQKHSPLLGRFAAHS